MATRSLFRHPLEWTTSFPLSRMRKSLCTFLPLPHEEELMHLPPLPHAGELMYLPPLPHEEELMHLPPLPHEEELMHLPPLPHAGEGRGEGIQPTRLQ